MATETIYISLVTGTTNLHLSDNEGHSGDGTITTDVSPGDTVTWKISGSGISGITSIYAKPDSQDIFSSDPAKNPDGSWTGTVSSSATGQESYGIKYMVSGTEYDDDPILRINPDGD